MRLSLLAVQIRFTLLWTHFVKTGPTHLYVLVCAMCRMWRVIVCWGHMGRLWRDSHVMSSFVMVVVHHRDMLIRYLCLSQRRQGNRSVQRYPVCTKVTSIKFQNEDPLLCDILSTHAQKSTTDSLRTQPLVSEVGLFWTFPTMSTSIWRKGQ